LGTSQASERQEKTKLWPDSVLSGVAGHLPALIECEKIPGSCCASTVFDWPDVPPVLQKCKRNWRKSNSLESGDKAHIQEESVIYYCSLLI